MASKLRYRPGELDTLKDLYVAGRNPTEIARDLNDRFHKGMSIRTSQSVHGQIHVHKLCPEGGRFKKTCEVCGIEFRHSWPQARYCASQECRAVADRDIMKRAYRLDPAKNIQAQTVRKRALSQRRWQRIFELKGRTCSRCGNAYPAVVFDLHHVNGKGSRKDTPARIIRSGTEAAFEKLLEETELLCANCHRLTHAESGDWAPRINGKS